MSEKGKRFARKVVNKTANIARKTANRLRRASTVLAFLISPPGLITILATIGIITILSLLSVFGSTSFGTTCSDLKAPVFSTASTKEEKEAYLFSYFSSFLGEKELAGETAAYVMDRTGGNVFSSKGMFDYTSKDKTTMVEIAKEEEVDSWYSRSDIQLDLARDRIVSGIIPEDLSQVVKKINPSHSAPGNHKSEGSRIVKEYKDFDSGCKFYGQGGGGMGGKGQDLDLSDAVKLAMQLAPFDWGVKIGTISSQQSDFQRANPKYDYISGDMDGIKLGRISHPEFSELRNKIIDEKGGSDRKLADCGKFVSTIVIASKMDEGFPRALVSAMDEYILKHPEKWRKVPMSERAPGDIMIQGDNSHIVFYLGKIDGQDAVVQASWDQYLPMKSKHSSSWFENYYGESGLKYKFYRPVK